MYALRLSGIRERVRAWAWAWAWARARYTHRTDTKLPTATIHTTIIVPVECIWSYGLYTHGVPTWEAAGEDIILQGSVKSTPGFMLTLFPLQFNLDII